MWPNTPNQAKYLPETEMISADAPSTPERPGNNVTLHNRSPTSILNDDALLDIFEHCRLQDGEVWNYQLRWCKLSHVCRKWRQLIYESSSHLKMQIILTNSKEPLYILPHLPPLPLVIDYTSAEHAEDNSGILHAIQQRDRIHRVVLQVTGSALNFGTINWDYRRTISKTRCSGSIIHNQV